MSNERLESKVWNFLSSEGIPLMGIAGVCPLPNVPETYSPQTNLREARSVICYGVPIPKGIIYAERDALWLYWRYWNITYRSLDVMAHRLCLMLEEKSHRVLRDPSTKGKYSFETLNNVIGVDDHSSYVCFECLKACPLNGVQ